MKWSDRKPQVTGSHFINHQNCSFEDLTKSRYLWFIRGPPQKERVPTFCHSTPEQITCTSASCSAAEEADKREEVEKENEEEEKEKPLCSSALACDVASEQRCSASGLAASGHGAHLHAKGERGRHLMHRNGKTWGIKPQTKQQQKLGELNILL